MSKVSAYGQIPALASGDTLPIVDVSDTTQAATGSTKKVAISQLDARYESAGAAATAQAAAEATAASALSTHSSDTTSVHGIADTSALVTTTSLATSLADYTTTAAAPELIRDTIGTALTAGPNIDITVSDAGDTITIGRSALPATVAFVGDSIIANGGVKAPTGIADFDGRAWCMWASMISGGQFVVGRVAGVQGDTTTDLLETTLPTVLADSPKPGYCVILIGHNDGALSFSTTKSNLTSIWDQLVAAGIQPVLCTLTPTTGASSTHRAKVDVLLRYTARERGWPLIDFATDTRLLKTDGSGEMVTGLTDDGIHPNNAGAKVMGTIVAEKLANVLPPFTPPLVTLNTVGDNIGNTTNACFSTDTNADGVPDTWTRTESTGTGIATQLNSGAGIIGKQLQLTGGTGSCSVLSTNSAFTPGHVVYLGCRVEAEYVGGQIWLDLALGTNIKAAMEGITTSIPAGSVFSFFMTVPTGVTNCQVWALSLNGSGNVIKLSQVTRYSLTSMGVV